MYVESELARAALRKLRNYETLHAGTAHYNPWADIITRLDGYDEEATRRVDVDGTHWRVVVDGWLIEPVCYYGSEREWAAVEQYNAPEPTTLGRQCYASSIDAAERYYAGLLAVLFGDYYAAAACELVGHQLGHELAAWEHGRIVFPKVNLGESALERLDALIASADPDDPELTAAPTARLAAAIRQEASKAA